jgi:hypothetical protein
MCLRERAPLGNTLCGRARIVEGSIGLAKIGLEPARAYVFDEPRASSAVGKLVVKAALGSWGTEMA